MSFKRPLLLLIILLAFLTRFFGLSWGNGYYFHPDENNMASALSQLSSSNFNPHFFAYGQFPLYLGYFSLKVLSVPNSFSASVLILRFWSAVFSILSILFIYLISRKLFSRLSSVFIVLLIIFNPGLIQLAHFGTTESLLILVFLINIFLGFKIIDHPHNYYLYFFGALVTGVGLASKISSLIFLGPILLAALLNFTVSRRRLTYLPKLFLLLYFSLIFYFIFSPYNLLAKNDFLSSLSYETAVATGQTKVFYTTQFQKTLPYLFQFTKIFPYVSGLPVFIFAIFGFVFFFINWKKERKNFKYWLLILVPSLVYFLYFGRLYVKWTRFSSPLFFLFPLFAVYLIAQIKKFFPKLLLIIICCLPGIYFFNIYLHSDIRISASNWIEKNIPADSQIFSEGGNVINLPLGQVSYKVNNYDFYGNYDRDTLAAALVDSQYILVPSRRVFENYSFTYYRHLFDGSLGFIEIKQFSPKTDMFLNSETAEETWSVFDHPTIRIYKKVKKLTLSEYQQLLSP